MLSRWEEQENVPLFQDDNFVFHYPCTAGATAENSNTYIRNYFCRVGDIMTLRSSPYRLLTPTRIDN